MKKLKIEYIPVYFRMLVFFAVFFILFDIVFHIIRTLWSSQPYSAPLGEYARRSIFYIIVFPLFWYRKYTGIRKAVRFDDKQETMNNIKAVMTGMKWKLQDESDDMLLFHSPFLPDIWKCSIEIQFIYSEVYFKGPLQYIDIVINKLGLPYEVYTINN